MLGDLVEFSAAGEDAQLITVLHRVGNDTDLFFSGKGLVELDFFVKFVENKDLGSIQTHAVTCPKHYDESPLVWRLHESFDKTPERVVALLVGDVVVFEVFVEYVAVVLSEVGDAEEVSGKHDALVVLFNCGEVWVELLCLSIGSPGVDSVVELLYDCEDELVLGYE